MLQSVEVSKQEQLKNLVQKLYHEALAASITLQCEINFQNASKELGGKTLAEYSEYLLKQLVVAWEITFPDSKDAGTITQTERERIMLEVREKLGDISRGTLEQSGESFFKCFERHVNTKETSHSLAIVYGRTSWTYDELNIRANYVANSLLSLKNKEGGSLLNPGDCIALFFENSPEAIAAIIGVMKAGFAYVPLTTDAKLPLERLKYYVEASKARLLISQDKLLNHDLIPYMGSAITTLGYSSLNSSVATNPDVVVSKHDTAYKIFSSGTTGLPKGIEITHKGLLSPAKEIAQVYGLKSHQRVGWHSLLTFDASLIDIMTALANQATVVIVPQAIRTDSKELVKYLRENRVNFITLVPSILQKLDDNDVNVLCENLKGIISTGERGEEKVLNKLIQRKCKVFNGYGPTEVSGVTSVSEYTGKELHIGENPIQGLQWFILSKPSEEEPFPITPKMVKEGEEGELYISGEGLAKQYIVSKQQEDLQARFREISHPEMPEKKLRVYQTGDIVRKEHKKLILIGRQDRQYKYLGQLIHPDTIKNAMLSLTINDKKVFKNVCVLIPPLAAAQSLPVLCAYVQSDEVELTESLIREVYLELRYHPFCNVIPSRFRIVKEWPALYNANGKVDEKDLHAALLKENCETLYCQPPLHLEQELSEQNQQIAKAITTIWYEMLDLNNENITLSLDHNFIELGGDSIRVNQMLAQVAKLPNVKKVPSLNQFAINATIRSLLFRAINGRHARHTIEACNEGQWVKIEDKHPPILLINSVTGRAEQEYRNVIRAFTENMSAHPLFYMNALTLKKPGYVVESIEELAGDYVKSILEDEAFKEFLDRKSSPLLLFGYSAAGTLAYEISRQLKLKGYLVAICCIDSLSANYYQSLSQQNYAEEIHSLMTRMMTKVMGFDPDSANQIMSLDELKKYAKSEQLDIYWKKFLGFLNDKKIDNRKKEEILGFYSTHKNLIQTQLRYQAKPGIDYGILIRFSETKAKCERTLKRDGMTLCWDEKLQFEVAPTNGEHLDLVTETKWEEMKKDFMSIVISFVNGARSKISLKQLVSYTNNMNSAEDPDDLTNSDAIVLTNASKKEFNFENYCDYLKRAHNSQALRLLVNGLNGCGKSTLAKLTAKRWVKGNLASYKLVVYSKVEEFNSANSSDPLYKLQECLELVDGHSLLILDGYDHRTAGQELDKVINDLLAHSNLSVIVMSEGPLSILQDRIGVNDALKLTITKDNIGLYIQHYFTLHSQVKLGEQLLDKIRRDPHLDKIIHTISHLKQLCDYWMDHHADAQSYMFVANFCKQIVNTAWQDLRSKLKKISNTQATIDNEEFAEAQQRVQNVLESLAAQTWPKTQVAESVLEEIMANYYKAKFGEDIGTERLNRFIRDILIASFLTVEYSSSGGHRSLEFNDEILVEYLASQFVRKHISLENSNQLKKYQPLIEKYTIRIESLRNIDDNTELKKLLNTKRIESLPEHDRKEIINAAYDSGYLNNNIKKSPLYKIIVDKLTIEGAKEVSRELKGKYGNNNNLKSVLSEIYLFKPDNSLVNYLSKDEGFFQGKVLYISDPVTHLTKNSEITSVERKSHNLIEFSLTDNSKIKVMIDHKNNIERVYLITSNRYDLSSYLTTYDNKDNKKRIVNIATSNHDASIKEGSYCLEYRQPRTQQGHMFKRTFILRSPTSNQSIYTLNVTDYGNIEGLDVEIVSDDFEPIKLKLDKLNFSINVEVEEQFLGIHSESAKDSIKVKNKDVHENDLRSQRLVEINKNIDRLISALKEDGKSLEILLTDFFEHRLESFSANPFSKLPNNTIKGIQNLETVLRRLSKDYESISAKYSSLDILKNIVLKATYASIEDKEKTPHVLKTMNLLTKGNKYLKTVDGKDLILFAGNTGAGKTTLVSYYLGYKLVEALNEHNQTIIKLKDESKIKFKDECDADTDIESESESNPHIGHAIGTSDTSFVEAFRIINSIEGLENHRLCDTPGSRDTRGEQWDLATLISIDQAIDRAKSIKALVLAIPYEAFLLDRGNLVVELFQNLRQRIPTLFTDPAVRKSIFISVTKFYNESKPEERLIGILNAFCDAEKKLQSFQEGALAKSSVTLRDSYDLDIVNRRLEVWNLLVEIANSSPSRLLLMNIENKLRRVQDLQQLAAAPGIHRSLFSKALDSDHIQRHFGQCIQTSIHTWQSLIFENFLSLQKEEQEKKEGISNRQNNKIELEKQNENIKKTQAECDNKIKELDLQTAKLKQLKETKNISENQELMSILKKSIEAAEQSKKDLLGTKNASLEDVKNKIADIEKAIIKSDEKIRQLKLARSAGEQEITDLDSEIKNLSEGTQKIVLWEISYEKNSPLLIGVYKDGTHQLQFEQIRPPEEGELLSTIEAVAGEYTGKLIYNAYIKKEYRVVPADPEDNRKFLTSGAGGFYIANIEGRSWEPYKGYGKGGKNAALDGSKMVYAIETTWRKNDVIPYVCISHTMPNAEINAALIENRRSDKPQKETKLKATRADLSKASKDRSELKESLKVEKAQQKTIEHEVLQIKREAEREGVDDVIKQNSETIEGFKAQIKSLSDQVQKNRDSIAANLNQISLIEDELQKLRLKKIHLIVTIKTHGNIAKLLREFTQLALSKRLGIEDKNLHSTLHKECAAYISYYDLHIKKIEQTCKIELENAKSAAHLTNLRSVRTGSTLPVEPVKVSASRNSFFAVDKPSAKGLVPQATAATTVHKAAESSKLNELWSKAKILAKSNIGLDEVLVIFDDKATAEKFLSQCKPIQKEKVEATFVMGSQKFRITLNATEYNKLKGDNDAFTKAKKASEQQSSNIKAVRR